MNTFSWSPAPIDRFGADRRAARVLIVRLTDHCALRGPPA
jgi:hypothetical protein